MFDSDAVFFEHTNSHRVSFLNTHTGKGVTMDYPDFESIAFWTPAGGNAPFLCLEPWNGSAIFHQDSDIFSEKRGILSLMPEAEKTYHLKISFLSALYMQFIFALFALSDTLSKRENHSRRY